MERRGLQEVCGKKTTSSCRKLKHACTETVKLDANKTKEHLASENATTRVDRTKRSTEVEHKIRAEGVGGGGGETRNRERERGSTKTVRSQEEPEVERCHRFRCLHQWH